MKAVAAIAIAAAGLVTAVPLAATAVDSDMQYVVRCASDTGRVVAGSYPVPLLDFGAGKTHALELFKQSHPDWHCWATGPQRVK